MMTRMFEVYYQAPTDTTREARLSDAAATHGGWLDYREAPGDNFRVRLAECRDERPAGELGNHAYFVYLTVEGLDQLHEELSARGAPVISAPEDQPWGMREFSTRTPDGHRIRFGEPIAAG